VKNNDNCGSGLFWQHIYVSWGRAKLVSCSNLIIKINYYLYFKMFLFLYIKVIKCSINNRCIEF